MADRWRFRTNWRGKLILQKRITIHNIYILGETYKWIDATAGDLLVFAKELK